MENNKEEKKDLIEQEENKIETNLDQNMNLDKKSKAVKKKKTVKIPLRTIIVLVIIVIVLVLAYIFKGVFIAASVNGDPISRLSVIHKLEKGSGKTLLDTMIEQKLVNDEAQARNIEISQDEVDAEIENIRGQVQGSLEDELVLQGMTMEDLRNQIVLQKEIDAMLADKVEVTDAEVEQYITDYALEIADEQKEIYTEQIRSQIKNQKFGQEFNSLLTQLKDKADIKYFVEY